MAKTLWITLFILGGIVHEQNSNKPTLKSILLEQLRTTHDVQDWFVPIDSAIAGLTAQQANWTDGKGSHSIAQLRTILFSGMNGHSGN